MTRCTKALSCFVILAAALLTGCVYEPGPYYRHSYYHPYAAVWIPGHWGGNRGDVWIAGHWR